MKKYSVVIVMFVLFLQGCGGGASSSVDNNETNNLLPRIILTHSNNITCSNTQRFEVVPYGDVDLEVTTNINEQYTNIYAQSQSGFGYLIINDCLRLN